MIYILNGVTLSSVKALDESGHPNSTIQTDYYRLLLHANQFSVNVDITSDDGLLNARNTTLMIDIFENTTEKLLENVLIRVTGNLKVALQKQKEDASKINAMDNLYLTYFDKTEESFIPMFVVDAINASADSPVDQSKNDEFSQFISEDATKYPDDTHEDNSNIHINIRHLVQQEIIRSNLTILRSVITQIEKAVQ